ncbi:hypothetical protein NODU109028_09595 [Nocardioides dubius]|uniref:Uncharacterized protein n=1 Tax=Nocardioides dubius TaxID=317019 RepID=A0ABP4EKD7_9ACTN
MATLRTTDALTAALAFGWYAAPDVLPERRSRIAAKAALLVGGSLLMGLLERDALAELTAEAPSAGSGEQPDSSRSSAPTEPEVPLAPAMRDVAAVVVSGLVVDQVMRRISRHRRARGKRFAHLPAAALATGYTLATAPWMRRIEDRVDAANRGAD